MVVGRANAVIPAGGQLEVVLTRLKQRKSEATRTPVDVHLSGNRHRDVVGVSLSRFVWRVEALASRCQRCPQHLGSGAGQSARGMPTCLFDHSMGTP